MQSFKDKVSSAKGKTLTIIQDGVEPFLEGKFNFENKNLDIELLASERKEICLTCDYYEEEPIESCQVTDKNIPELTNKMCGDCFCILSYKLRQSKIKCSKWLE
jgi:hypothetical protein